MASNDDSATPRRGFKLGGVPSSPASSATPEVPTGKFKLGAPGGSQDGVRVVGDDVSSSGASPGGAGGDAGVAPVAPDSGASTPALRFGRGGGVSPSGKSLPSSEGGEEVAGGDSPVPLRLGGLKRSGVPGGSGVGVPSSLDDSSSGGGGGVVSPGGEDSLEEFSSPVDDGFGDFFEDLDDYGRELEESFAAAASPVSEPSLEDDVEVVPGGVEGDDVFDAQLEELLGGEDELVAGVERKDLLPEGYERLAARKVERDANVEHRRKKAARKASKRLAKNGGSTVYRKPLRGIETKRAARGPREVLVDGQGEWHKPGVASSAEEFDVLFSRLSDAAESGAEVDVSPEDEARAVNVNPGKLEVRGKVIFPLVRSEDGGGEVSGGRKKQRLNEGELRFYRSLQSSKKEVLDSQVVRDVMRMPTAGVGSTAVVKAQRAVVAGASGSLQSQWGGALRAPDFEILRFLAKFRYAHHEHISRLWGVKPVTAVKHLRKLEAKGLVERVKVVNTHAVWVLTSAGMLLSGYDLPLVTAQNMSPQLIPHQFTVNHIAANLWGGQLNVLDLDEWPVKNRVDVNGLPRFGEELVSETQLHSSFASVKGLSDATVFRERVRNLTDDAFERWEARGGAAAGIPSPEFEPGNEFMWILFPPASVRRAYHFPDLVLRRPRNPDGSPESIAIEIETVAAKGEERYRPALKAYNFDTRFYKKVIWVCRTNASNNSIVKGSKPLDLWRENRIEVVSILTDDGIFESRDLWKI